MISRGSLAVFGVSVLLGCPAIAIAQTTPPAVVTAPVPIPKAILTDAEKEKDIRQLITLTGGDKMGQQMLDQIIPEMQKMAPEVPEDFWLKFRAKFKMSTLVDRLLPVYDKYYSKEDVKGLIQFYQTPLGQRVIATLPGLSHDSQVVGSAWGQEIAQEVIHDIKEREASQTPAKTKPAKKAAPKSKSASR